jgi:5-methylcytosine-specific restriction protein A
MVGFQRRPAFRQIRTDYRASSGARGYGRRWQRYSQSRLVSFPECVKCQNPAQCTDHIQPVTGPQDPLFWDVTNHQSLCQTCHGKKTATEVNGQQLRTNDGSTGTETQC